ncbi:MAG: TetR family transcriptional regulator [Acidobacteria bacterium]|nr:TetR family transcriptional regulator [Acidobacteriota bacterium]
MPTTTLKEPVLKAGGRKSDILRKAAQVFLELGYDATSMNVVAERADVTKMGLYYHFDSKQELLFSIMSYAMDVLERATQAASEAARNSEERLRNLIHTLATQTTQQEDGAFVILVIDETNALEGEDRKIITARKRAYVETIRVALEALRAEGQLRRLDTTVAAFTLVGMVLWLSKWYEKAGRVSPEDVAHQVTEMALAAVLQPA